MRQMPCAVLLSIVAALICAGCADITWDQDVDRAEQRAKAEKKVLFVYYWRMLDNDSNRTYADVLRQPEVARLFQNTVNAQVCYDVKAHRLYMGRHGVEQAPAFLIKRPDGSFDRHVGYMTRDAFLGWAEAAMKGTTERPAKPPPITPQKAP